MEERLVRTEEEHFHHSRAQHIGDWIISEATKAITDNIEAKSHGDLVEKVKMDFSKFHPDGKSDHVEVRAFSIHSGPNVEFNEKYKYTKKPLMKRNTVVVYVVIRFHSSLSIQYTPLRFTNDRMVIAEVLQNQDAVEAIKSSMIVGASYPEIWECVFDQMRRLDPMSSGEFKFRDTVMIPIISADHESTGRGSNPLKEHATRNGFTLREGMVFFVCFGFIKKTVDKKKIYGVIHGQTVVIKREGGAEPFPSIPKLSDTKMKKPINVNCVKKQQVVKKKPTNIKDEIKKERDTSATSVKTETTKKAIQLTCNDGIVKEESRNVKNVKPDYSTKTTPKPAEKNTASQYTKMKDGTRAHNVKQEGVDESKITSTPEYRETKNLKPGMSVRNEVCKGTSVNKKTPRSVDRVRKDVDHEELNTGSKMKYGNGDADSTGDAVMLYKGSFLKEDENFQDHESFASPATFRRSLRLSDGFHGVGLSVTKYISPKSGCGTKK